MAIDYKAMTLPQIRDTLLPGSRVACGDHGMDADVQVDYIEGAIVLKMCRADGTGMVVRSVPKGDAVNRLSERRPFSSLWDEIAQEVAGKGSG